MIGFPLLLIPFAIYNIFVFLMPGVAFTAPLASVTLTSGAQWAPTFGDALLALGVVLLLFEVVKAARPGARYLTDHLLSLIVSGAAVAEFLLLAPFGTSTFFLLSLLMIVEFFAGISIGFRNRHRRVPVAAPAGGPSEPVSGQSHPGPAEPSFDRPQQDINLAEPALSPAQPASEVAPKPVPTLAVIRNPANTLAAERKVADWSVADLVSDHVPENPVKAPPKS